MADFARTVRLQGILPEEIAARITDGMWRQLEREHGPGQRSDHQELDLTDAGYTHHCVEWSPT